MFHIGTSWSNWYPIIPSRQTLWWEGLGTLWRRLLLHPWSAATLQIYSTKWMLQMSLHQNNVPRMRVPCNDLLIGLHPVVLQTWHRTCIRHNCGGWENKLQLFIDCGLQTTFALPLWWSWFTSVMILWHNNMFCKMDSFLHILRPRKWLKKELKPQTQAFAPYCGAVSDFICCDY